MAGLVIPGERRSCNYKLSALNSFVYANIKCQIGALEYFSFIVISIGAPTWRTHLCSDIDATSALVKLVTRVAHAVALKI